MLRGCFGREWLFSMNFGRCDGGCTVDGAVEVELEIWMWM